MQEIETFTDGGIFPGQYIRLDQYHLQYLIEKIQWNAIKINPLEKGRMQIEIGTPDVALIHFEYQSAYNSEINEWNYTQLSINVDAHLTQQKSESLRKLVGTWFKPAHEFKVSYDAQYETEKKASQAINAQKKQMKKDDKIPESWCGIIAAAKMEGSFKPVVDKEGEGGTQTLRIICLINTFYNNIWEIFNKILTPDITEDVFPEKIEIISFNHTKIDDKEIDYQRINLQFKKLSPGKEKDGKDKEMKPFLLEKYRGFETVNQGCKPTHGLFVSNLELEGNPFAIPKEVVDMENYYQAVHNQVIFGLPEQEVETPIIKQKTLVKFFTETAKKNIIMFDICPQIMYGQRKLTGKKLPTDKKDSTWLGGRVTTKCEIIGIVDVLPLQNGVEKQIDTVKEEKLDNKARREKNLALVEADKPVEKVEKVERLPVEVQHEEVILDAPEEGKEGEDAGSQYSDYSGESAPEDDGF